MLIGTLALVTSLIFSGADHAHSAPPAAAIDAGDIDFIHVLHLEIFHAGA